MASKIGKKQLEDLAGAALFMRKRSYAPFSKWTVGAALLAKDGTVYTGCNIENSAFSPTCCAERTAFFKAISEGCTDFKAIVIAGGEEGKDPEDFCAPCGVCRQVMQEFCDPETFEIILVKSQKEYVRYTLKEMLPLGFNL